MKERRYWFCLLSLFLCLSCSTQEDSWSPPSTQVENTEQVYFVKNKGRAEQIGLFSLINDDYPLHVLSDGDCVIVYKEHFPIKLMVLNEQGDYGVFEFLSQENFQEPSHVVGHSFFDETLFPSFTAVETNPCPSKENN